MLRRNTQRGERAAFTMVELLVVIAIIAVLVSLTAAAVMKVLGKIPEIQTRTDIAQMDQGLASFMADYGLQNPPPSFLYIREDGQYNTSTNPDLATVQFFQQWLGKSFNVKGSYDWNGNGKIDQPYTLQGEQCLVFYLGGIPVYNTATTPPTIGMTGFSPNNANPAATAAAGSTRKGPYFNFAPQRLTTTLYAGTAQQVQLMFPVYLDAWKASLATNNLGPQPYAFFSTQGKLNNYNPLTNNSGGDCSSIGAGPYMESSSNYSFNNRYQIISAGQNGLFGSGIWLPVATGAGKDDQANFSSGLLGAGQQ